MTARNRDAQWLDRTALQPTVHHLMAFAFRYVVADGAFWPATRRLTVFEWGANDARPDVAYPWLGAGYLVPRVPHGERGVEAVEVTNAYEGGALVPHRMDALVTGVRLAPPTTVRLVPAPGVGGDDATPAFPRAGGTVDGDLAAELSRFTALFWGAFAQGAYGELLADVGRDVGGSLFLDSVSELAAGRADGDGLSWRPPRLTPILGGQVGTHPNRMRFTFPGSVDRVTLPSSATRPADGTFAVLDIDVRVTAAAGKVDEWGEWGFKPYTEADARKVAAWEAAAVEGRLRRGGAGRWRALRRE